VTFTDAATGNVAYAWVQKDVATASGATIKIKGVGWADQLGTGASTVALKLNFGDGRQYTRSGAGVVAHPSAVGDDTIWVLLAPSNPQGHPNVRAVAPGFEIEIDAPPGLKAGQYLSVLFQSGRFDSGDVLRTGTTAALTVGGVPYSADGDPEQATCVPSVPTPTVAIANPEVSLGDSLRVSGQGWCHPDARRGGSVIAVKIDDGGYSRVDSALHQNRSIWAILATNPVDGSFQAEIPLPDGTSASSAPAFAPGAHTLRLLTGSLKAGDVVRTVESGEFVVGAYQPLGAPDPVEAGEELTERARGGVGVSLVGGAVSVVVPGAALGDWVYLNVFDGAVPLFPWGASWFRADGAGRVAAGPLPAGLPVGSLKLSAQSGNRGRVGELLGWAALTVAGTPGGEKGTGGTGKDDGDDTGGDGADSAKSTGGKKVKLAVSYVRISGGQAPTKVPAAPVARASQLFDSADGGATSSLSGDKLTVVVPRARAQEWVYVYVYTGAARAPLGWVRMDEKRQFSVELTAPGRHRLAIMAADGTLLGWTAVAIADPSAPVEAEPAAPAPPQASVAPVAPTPPSPEPPPATAPAAEPQASLDLPLVLAAAAVLAGGAATVAALGFRGRRRMG
jgi:hypothetical protein